MVCMTDQHLYVTVSAEKALWVVGALMFLSWQPQSNCGYWSYMTLLVKYLCAGSKEPVV